MNKLPKLYTSSFDKKIDNSLEYTKVENKQTNEKKLSNYDIREKINTIFKSKNYIYKINVEIKLINETIKTSIIGKTKKGLITIDNKLINIDDIIDIKISA